MSTGRTDRLHRLPTGVVPAAHWGCTGCPWRSRSRISRGCGGISGEVAADLQVKLRDRRLSASSGNVRIMQNAGNAVRLMPLAGRVPVVTSRSPDEDFKASASDFAGQLNEWGFMAFEIPGINDRITALHSAFGAACQSRSPRLTDFHYISVPQLGGGNHGFFPFASEIPRL